jgi:hypothetical protein
MYEGYCVQVRLDLVVLAVPLASYQKEPSHSQALC